MGFLDRFKGKKEQPQAGEEKPEEAEIPKSGTIAVLWGPSDRRPADQNELKALQESMSAIADDRIAAYSKVLDPDASGPALGRLTAKEAGLLQFMLDNCVAVGAMPRVLGDSLGMERKQWEPAISKLYSLGYLCDGTIEDRIAVDPSGIADRLKGYGIEIISTDEMGCIKEIMEKTNPDILEKSVADIPELYAVTEEGAAYLEHYPFLADFFSEDEYGLTIEQAAILNTYGNKDLFASCERMYMDLTEAYWAKSDYKNYLDYSERLAYLEMRRNPDKASYALAHLINANSIYKSNKILWEAPLKKVYANTDLTPEDIARYATEEFTFGIYPKRTKVDIFAEIFKKYLKDTEKV